ncbi:MAG: endonuclease III [Kofleriaceae bacterium]
MGGRSRNSTAGRAKPIRIKKATNATVEATAAIAAGLAERWPGVVVELDHQNAYQLLVATMLAAQSTDKIINTLTPAVFARYPDAASLAQANQVELEQLVFKSGFYRQKSGALIKTAQAIVQNFGGEVPATMEGLVSLPGVARKTANVVLGNALGLNIGIVVDTHITRLAPRLGLSNQTDPVKIENELMQLVPQAQWTAFGNHMIHHGRYLCRAKDPQCEQCPIAPLCPSNGLGIRLKTKPKAAKPTTKPAKKPATMKKAKAKA